MAVSSKTSLVKKKKKVASVKKTVKKVSSKKTVGKNFRKDSKQTASLVKVGKLSSAKAIRESKALGLSIAFIENGVLYKELANGSRVVVMNQEKPEKPKTSRVIKKGMIFHAKK